MAGEQTDHPWAPGRIERVLGSSVFDTQARDLGE